MLLGSFNVTILEGCTAFRLGWVIVDFLGYVSVYPVTVRKMLLKDR